MMKKVMLFMLVTVMLVGFAQTGFSMVVTQVEYTFGDDGVGANNVPLDSSGNGRDVWNPYGNNATVFLTGGPEGDAYYSFNADGGFYGYTYNNPEDNVGIEAVVRTSNLTQITTHIIGTGSNTHGIALEYDQTQGGFAGSLGLEAGPEWVGDAYTPTAGEWVHVALVTDDGATTYYVNGAVSGASTTTALRPVANNIHIGVNAGATAQYDGDIAYSRIFTFNPGEFEVSDLMYTPPSVAAHSPDPAGPVVNSVDVPAYAASGVSWYSPLQDSAGNAITDSNIVSVDGYDVYWSVGVEPNKLTDTPTNQTAQTYTPTQPITYDTTYYWIVDTYITWDSNEITGNFTDKIEGSTWSFTTESAYTPVVIDSFANVITTVDIGTAGLVAVVSGNSTPIASVVFEILTDDSEYPSGSDAVLSNDGPTALTTTLSTSVAGTYKVKVTVTDTPTSGAPAVVSAIAGVVVYADACEAKKASPGGWTANFYDADDDCDVDVVDLAVLAVDWLDDTSLDAQESYTGVADYVPQAVFDTRIEAEWFDPNDPNACSDGPANDTTGIRIQEQPNASGGQATGYSSATAWVEYTIDVPAAAVGNAVDVYAGHALTGTGTVTLSFGTEATPDAYGVGTLDGTSGWTNFSDGRKIGTVAFTAAGPQIVRTSYGGGLNLDWFSFDW